MLDKRAGPSSRDHVRIPSTSCPQLAPKRVTLSPSTAITTNEQFYHQLFRSTTTSAPPTTAIMSTATSSRGRNGRKRTSDDAPYAAPSGAASALKRAAADPETAPLHRAKRKRLAPAPTIHPSMASSGGYMASLRGGDFDEDESPADAVVRFFVAPVATNIRTHTKVYSGRLYIHSNDRPHSLLGRVRLGPKHPPIPAHRPRPALALCPPLRPLLPVRLTLRRLFHPSHVPSHPLP
jgi:hypothetical protein